MEHVSVCVATYGRPGLLNKLLDSLIVLRTDDSFTFSILVVDNDCHQSARAIVERIRASALVAVEYRLCPRKSLSLARNTCVENARGDYIAFIDDDEYADPQWLLNLVRCARLYAADVVHGPVRPYFGRPVPEWIRRNIAFEPLRYKTGVSWYSTKATNNCLIRRRVFDEKRLRFDPVYGLTGGEDTEFFFRVRRVGYRFSWCAEALTYEYFGPERANISWILSRARRSGNTCFRVYAGSRSRWGRVRRLLYILVRMVLVVAVSPAFFLAALFSMRYPFFPVYKLFFYAGEFDGFMGRMVCEYPECAVISV
jgi:succinoglycan biosynthesis protein ExoM